MFTSDKPLVSKKSRIGEGITGRLSVASVVGRGEGKAGSAGGLHQQWIDIVGGLYIYYIVLEYKVKVLETPIVHVRGGEGYIAQGGYLETVFIALLSSDAHPPIVFTVRIETIVAKAEISKEGFFVAGGALRFEYGITFGFHFGKGEAVFFAHHFIILAIGANHGRHKLAQCLHYAGGSDLAVAESSTEVYRVIGIFPDLLHHVFHGFAHFHMAGDGHQGLQIEVGHTSIPHKGFCPCQVLQGWCIASTQGIKNAMAQTVTMMGKSGGLNMAGAAADGAIL